MQLDLLHEVGTARHLTDEDGEVRLGRRAELGDSAGRGSLTNFACGVLLHPRIARYARGPSGGVEDAVGLVRAADVLHDEAEVRGGIADGLLECRRRAGDRSSQPRADRFKHGRL